MKRIVFVLMVVGVCGFAVSTCQTSKSVSIPQDPYEKLSEYNFFKGTLSDLDPVETVLPYDLNTPLFTDYAYKARFVWMPEGSSANYTTDQVLDFPEKTVLMKNFYYLNDERDPSLGKRIIETRLLINRGAEWEAVTYTWNEAQTEAYRDVIGGIKAVSWFDKLGIEQDINYIIPNKNQCKSCHLTGKKQIPIGPKVSNLNKHYPYAEGAINQLEKWSEMGYLTGYQSADQHPKMAIWNDYNSGTLHQRALAYLDSNCGHCHNPNGSANTSGLHLTAGAKADMTLGIFKATVSAGAGTGGHTYSIVPGKPEASVMIYRMNSTDPGAMMPELGRSIVHTEGVELIAKWIENLPVDSTYQQTSNLR